MFSDDQEVLEVTVTELGRRASATVEVVESGARVIVSKNGRPVALITSIEDGVEVLLAGSQRFALLRREAREALEDGSVVPLPHWRNP